MTVRSSLAGGRQAGVASAVGITLGNVIWTIAATAGVVALLSASEPVFRALKLAGAAYLAYLGAQSLFAALRGRASEERRADGGGLTPRQALRQGLLSNLGNPKIAVFFASLLPQFVPEGQSSIAFLLAFGLVFCVLGLIWLSLYAVAVDRLRSLVVGPVRRALDAITGFVLVALGLRLATES